jgi:hypothetical protein
MYVCGFGQLFVLEKKARGTSLYGPAQKPVYAAHPLSKLEQISQTTEPSQDPCFAAYLLCK